MFEVTVIVLLVLMFLILIWVLYALHQTWELLAVMNGMLTKIILEHHETAEQLQLRVAAIPDAVFAKLEKDLPL